MNIPPILGQAQIIFKGYMREFSNLNGETCQYKMNGSQIYHRRDPPPSALLIHDNELPFECKMKNTSQSGVSHTIAFDDTTGCTS